MVLRRACFLSSERTMFHGANACVGRLQHRVARALIMLPPGARRQIHRAQLPLPERIV